MSDAPHAWFRVRDAVEPDDFAGMADVRAREGAGLASVEELACAAHARRPAQRYRAFVAERLGSAEIVGMAWVCEEELAPRPDLLTFDIRVPPELQGQGIGKALYAMALDEIRLHGVRYAQTSVWAALERARRFVTDRGFAEVWRRVDSEVEVASVDLTPYAGLEERLREGGVHIRTFAELGGDPDALHKLCDLDTRLWADIPYGDTVVRPGIEGYRRETVDNPDFIPDGCFIALNERGDYVGYSFLSGGDTSYNTEMTGVLPAFRGRGIALALKLRGIRYALAHGVPKLETQNDQANGAMLGLNRTLGFRPIGETIRYRREL